MYLYIYTRAFSAKTKLTSVPYALQQHVYDELLAFLLITTFIVRQTFPTDYPANSFETYAHSLTVFLIWPYVWITIFDFTKRPKKRSSLRQPTSDILISQQQLSIDASSTTTCATNVNGQHTEDELTTKMAIKIEVCDIETHVQVDSGDSLEPSTSYDQNEPNIATMPHSTLNNQSTITTATTLGSAMSTSPKKSGHGQDVKRITFDESCKKESFDDVNPNYPQISVVVRPPTPLRGDAIKPMNAASAANLLSARMLPMELRRHSSHATTSLTVREHAEKDRRHSGVNPNLLSLDPEHTKFLSSSPAASRRISCGSLFKVSSVSEYLILCI